MTSPFGEGSRFPTMNDARDALLNHIANRGESYVVDKSERERYTVRCRAGAACPFYVRIGWRRKEQRACVSVYRPHTCSPDTHQNWSRTSSVRYLAAKHRESFLTNRSLKPKDIQAVELLEGNTVSTAQAWRALKSLESDPTLGDQLESTPGGTSQTQGQDQDGELSQAQTSVPGSSSAIGGPAHGTQGHLASSDNASHILEAVLGNNAALSMLSGSDNPDELKQRVQDSLARLRGELIARKDLSKLKSDRAVALFGLRIVDEMGDMPVWRVAQEEPNIMVDISQWFESYWMMCRMNYSKASGTTVKAGIDIFLVEALRIAKEISNSPQVYQNLRVFPEAVMKYRCPRTKTEYFGRIDHSIGGKQSEDLNSFYSFTTICKAEGSDLNGALDQLLAYLGCMRSYRIRKQRKDLELHGIATDGFEWAFIRVGSNGQVVFSRKYNSRSKEERLAIMRSIVHVVRAAFNQLENFNVYGATDEILSETDNRLPRPVEEAGESNA